MSNKKSWTGTKAMGAKMVVALTVLVAMPTSTLAGYDYEPWKADGKPFSDADKKTVKDAIDLFGALTIETEKLGKIVLKDCAKCLKEMLDNDRMCEETGDLKDTAGASVKGDDEAKCDPKSDAMNVKKGGLFAVPELLAAVLAHEWCHTAQKSPVGTPEFEAPCYEVEIAVLDKLTGTANPAAKKAIKNRKDQMTKCLEDLEKKITKSPTATPSASPSSSPTTATVSPTTVTNSPTGGGGIETGSPTAPTASPTSSTGSPTAATDSPTATTGSPTTATDSPTAATDSPTAVTNSPTASPTDVTETPTAVTDKPTAVTNSPTGGGGSETGSPTGPTASPTSSTGSPTAATDSPTATTDSPTANPTAATNSPTDVFASPTASPTGATETPTAVTDSPTAVTDSPTGGEGTEMGSPTAPTATPTTPTTTTGTPTSVAPSTGVPTTGSPTTSLSGVPSISNVPSLSDSPSDTPTASPSFSPTTFARVRRELTTAARTPGRGGVIHQSARNILSTYSVFTSEAVLNLGNKDRRLKQFQLGIEIPLTMSVHEGLLSGGDDLVLVAGLVDSGVNGKIQVLRVNSVTLQVSPLFNVMLNERHPFSITFNPTSGLLYFLDTAQDEIVTYSFPSPWDSKEPTLVSIFATTTKIPELSDMLSIELLGNGNGYDLLGVADDLRGNDRTINPFAEVTKMYDTDKDGECDSYSVGQILDDLLIEPGYPDRVLAGDTQLSVTGNAGTIVEVFSYGDSPNSDPIESIGTSEIGASEVSVIVDLTRALIGGEHIRAVDTTNNLGANAPPVHVSPCPRTLNRKACRKPKKSNIVIRKLENNAQDRLFWKWVRGDTKFQHFGDPTSDTNYTLCTYSGSSLATSATVPYDSDKWQEKSSSRLLYRDSKDDSDGITNIVLKAFKNGKGRIFLRGKGEELPDLLPLPPSLPVMVQLFNSETSVCWQSFYKGPTVSVSNATHFIASL